MSKIVIVGGGIAGLVAAYTLKKQSPQLDVTILEAEREPGGQARAFSIDGLTVDHGSHVFFNYYRNVLTLLDELRGDPDIGPSMPALVPVRGWTLVDASGNQATLTQHPWLSWLSNTLAVFPSIMRIPWLRFGDKLRLAWAAFRLTLVPFRRFIDADRRTSQELGLEAGYSAPGVVAWNCASLGLTDLFVAEESGALFALKHRLLLATRNGLSYQIPAGSLSELLAKPLARKLETMGVTVVFGARAKNIDREDGARVSVVTYDADDETTSVSASHVIVALPPHRASELVTWVQAPWTQLQPVTPVLTVVLRLSGEVSALPDARALGLSRQHWAFSAVTNLSSWPEYASEDTTVLRCEIGHADLLPWGAETIDDDVIRLVKADLDRLFPEVAEMAVERFAIHRERTHLHTKWIRGEWGKKPMSAGDRDVGRGVFLAGDWTTRGTIGMEAATNSGIEAANHVLHAEGLPPVSFQDVLL